MTVRFSVARLDDGYSAGSSPGWAVVRTETGQPNKFASRIFVREQDACDHVQRLTLQETVRVRKATTLARSTSDLSI
jgi:hypothetical protein